MELVHRFSVPASTDEAWTALTHLERIAPCFPGATIETIEGSVFAGALKIKFGPVALAYNGTGTFLQRHDRSHRAVIEARGTDRRGNGTAVATFHVALHENGRLTDVEVKTDLAITGRPAQLGRGVISDVSDRLLDQFVDCLTPKFGQGIGQPLYDGPVEGKVAVPVAAQVGDRDFAGTTYTPPSDSSQTHFDVVRQLAPVVVRRWGPYVGAGLFFGWLCLRVIKSARRTAR